MPRLRHGMARVEFFAVQENVMALLAQGHTYASAYDLLKKEGKITMCYGAFRGYAHGGRRPKPDPEHGSKPATRENAVESTAKAASQNVKQTRVPRKATTPAQAFSNHVPDASELTKVTEE